MADITPANPPAGDFLDELRNAGQLRQGSIAAKFTLVGYGDWIRFPPPDMDFIQDVIESLEPAP